ncbi:MAG: hypothetical protein V3571_07700 [Pseudodesulfovibrio sp.]
MRTAALALALVLLTAIGTLAGRLDTVNPPYGERLEDLEYAKQFEPINEKGGVAYYRYTGPRDANPLYEIASSDVVYGFVEGRLYTCIYRNRDVPRDKVMELIRSTYGMTPKHTYNEGDWSVFVWYSPDEKTDFKLKFNNRTTEMKAAFYYRPLREKLPR